MAQLKFSILDVGHGDFSYVETPLGDTLVIDCGSGDVVPSQFLAKVPVINELHISHPHEDHFSDIAGLATKIIRSLRVPHLARFSDDKISWRTHDKGKISTLRNLERRVPVNDAAVRTDMTFSHQVFVPSLADVDTSDPNTASSVTIVRFGTVKALFGGDLPSNGWRALLRNQQFKNAIAGTTLYKTSHHGREVGCSEELFSHIKPMVCIVSDKMIDASNENTERIAWYRERTSGCKVNGLDGSVEERHVLTTRKDGSIHVVSDGRTWYCYSGTRWR